MRKHSLLEHFQVIAAAAAVGAHADAKAEGFRQRDVRFLMELFSNWLESAIDSSVFAVQNTQIARYLNGLAAEGLAKRSQRAKKPIYRLTRTGLIELISDIVSRPHFYRPEFFFFVYYFIDNYKERIFELVRMEGKQFPHSMELELRDLLNTENLLINQRENAEREISKLELRISDAVKATRLACDSFSKGLSVAETVDIIEKKYPYDLNSQKPLSELFRDMPDNAIRWELEVGGLMRANQIWMPLRSAFKQFVLSLEQLGSAC